MSPRFVLPVALLFVAGCLGASGTGPTAPGAEPDTGMNPTATPTDTTMQPTTPFPDSLSETLAGLVRATNRTAYATAHQLTLRNDTVLVVIELKPGRDLPAGYELRVDARYGRLVQAYAPIEALPSLAGAANVSAVRAPESPTAAGSWD